jgi:hypothetical protein
MNIHVTLKQDAGLQPTYIKTKLYTKLAVRYMIVRKI